MIVERLDVADCKDQLQVALHRGRYDFTLSRLPAGKRVLEIGTGVGAFTRELLPKCGSYVGVEFDPTACNEARQKTGGKAEIIQADARCLPFGDNQFSFIICLEVLEHLGDFAAGVRNIHRCIEPGGTAIVSVPYRRKGGKSEINEFHVYEPGERELVSLFESLFDKVEVYYQYFEETAFMSFARAFRLRRILGLNQIYADLSAGLPHATAKLRIGLKPRGMKTTLLLVAQGKKSAATGSPA